MALTVSKVGPAFVCERQPAVYTITVMNTSTTTAVTTVQLTDILPAGSVFVSFAQISPTPPTPPQFIVMAPAPTFGSCCAQFIQTANPTATIASLGAGQTAVFQLVLCLNARCAFTFTNTANVTGMVGGTMVSSTSSFVTSVIARRRRSRSDRCHSRSDRCERSRRCRRR